MNIGTKKVNHNTYEFIVWAPLVKKVELEIVFPFKKIFSMKKDYLGYWKVVVEKISCGTRYYYILDNTKRRPDPCSNFQPQGVHKMSEIVDHTKFVWEDKNWSGIPLEKMIIYELHTGTFTKEGTFDSITKKLDYLIDLGINTIELMPVAQFPGNRNWGYDGVHPFAVQNSYGGPNGLKRLVNECHKKNVAIILDVVYNHLGPEGNYLSDFGPYFTDNYKTPWGKAINFDGEYSSEVRKYFFENAIYWLENYHIDALRIDAVHAIYDFSAKPFLQELSEKIAEFNKTKNKICYLIAESNLNDSKLLRKKEFFGYGLDAQWCDDFHHSLHTIVTGENNGYYKDFGKISHLAKAIKNGIIYDGQYSEFRKRFYGNNFDDIESKQLIVFSQNHDQVGNRMLGERLATMVSFDKLKLVAGTVLLSPFVVMLFMGEEYAEQSPFLYFISHLDKNLVNAVRQGRKEEFKSFLWKGKIPDPQNMKTFIKSKLNWKLKNKGKHKIMLNFYKTLIKLRKTHPVLQNLTKKTVETNFFEEKKVVIMTRWKENQKIKCFFNYNDIDEQIFFDTEKVCWKKIFDSSDKKWAGKKVVAPKIVTSSLNIVIPKNSFVVYTKVD